MVVVKSLYVTFLIHKEQFALVSKSMHLRITIKLGFGGT